jgi:hypothetical protein
MKRNFTSRLPIMLILSVIVFFYSCKQEEIVVVSTLPLIKLVSVSKTSVVQFKDSLVITIEYNDGDGDIGETDPDKNAIQIKDSRLSKPDFYFVKPLSPPGSSIKTKGTIAVQLKNTFLLGTAATEVTNYELRLKDRAGNWSNTITTPDITITK